MSFREVNALRKSGQLDEAVAMAEKDVAQNRDKWSCRALFWCLYERSRQLQGDLLQECLERMRDLLKDMGCDEVATKCMTALDIPYRQEVYKAREMAKIEGRAEEAYRIVTQIYDNEQLDVSLHADYGWIIYRALHQDDKDDIAPRKRKLMRYLQLNIERPSLLHSLILSEAVRVERAAPLQFLFSAFLRLWDLQNIREEDKQPMATSDGKRIPSLVEKVIYAYIKEMVITDSVKPDDSIKALVDEAHCLNSREVLLLRAKALIQLREGDAEAARKIYVDCLLKGGDKFYLWSELADIVEEESLRIGLLCKAVSLRVPDDYLVNIRINLANAFIRIEDYESALLELKLVEKSYTQNGWSLKSSFHYLMSKIPNGTVAAANNKGVYATYIPYADEYVNATLSSILMVKVGEKQFAAEKNGRPHTIVKWQLQAQDGTRVSLQPRRLALSSAKNGSCLEVKILDGVVVWAKVVANPSLAWRKDVQGKLAIKINSRGKQFAILENCYVGAALLAKMSSGMNVRGVAVESEGRWQCVSLVEVE